MSDKPLDCVGTAGPVGKHDFKFVAAATNTGSVKRRYRTVTLKKNGVPIKAGDLKLDEIIEFDSETGEIVCPSIRTNT